MKRCLQKVCSEFKRGGDELLVFGMLVLGIIGMIYATEGILESSSFAVNSAVLAGERNSKQVVKYVATPLRVAPFAMPAIVEPIFPDRKCVITDFGAVSDGKISNTESFRKTIESCADLGGGSVVVPKGEWLTGAINLKNHINLHLEKGARVIFTNDVNEYLPAVFSRFEGIELYNYSPFIYAKDCKNIAITGEGDLDGNGRAWQEWNEVQEASIKKLVQLGDRGVPVRERNFAIPEEALQPSFVQFVGCENILLDGITLLNSPRWTIHPVYSANIIIRNIKVYTDARSTDGVVLDSSRNAIVQDSLFRVGDDAVVVKSGKDRDGLRVGKPSENIVIHDCTVEDGHGGIALGSEMSGGIRNVFVYNMDIIRADYGIRFKSLRGRGGVVEDVFFEDIRVKRAVFDAIHITMNYSTPLRKDDTSFLPVFRNISIKNVSVERSTVPFFLEGLPESPIRNLTFENVEIASLRKRKGDGCGGRIV